MEREVSICKSVTILYIHTCYIVITSVVTFVARQVHVHKTGMNNTFGTLKLNSKVNVSSLDNEKLRLRYLLYAFLSPYIRVLHLKAS